MATEYYEIVNSFDIDGPMIIDDRSYQQIPDRVKVIESNVAFWAVIDGVLLVFIIGGNILTILAVRFSRRLRSVISNMFVLSLAISDMVVGFTLPYHLAFYMGSGLGRSQGWCLLRFFLIILACCVSIWNLIAIAVDRYIAIVYPLHYSRYMTRKVALILLSFGWIVGATFASIPMFWNNWKTAKSCEFDEILPPWYMAGVITPGFSMVWVCMLLVYWRIWREASKHAKQLRSSFTGLHESPSDWKSVQVVLFILGCFSICWLPYFIVACAQIFKFLEESSPLLYKGAFSLAMANSGMNPIIYAWKNTSFRRAFARLLRCKSPDYNDVSQHSTRSNMHRKSSSIQQQDTINATITSTPPPHNNMLNGNFNNFENLPTDNYDIGIVNNSNCTTEDELTLKIRKKSVTLVQAPKIIPATTIVLANGQTIMNDNKTMKNFDLENSEELKLKHIYNGILKDSSAPEHFPENSDDNLVQHQNGIRHGRNLIIKQIECDGNGNTQISIVNGNKLDKLISEKNGIPNGQNSINLNGKLSNGNLFINNLNNFDSQIV